jgi:hypothetical protein
MYVCLFRDNATFKVGLNHLSDAHQHELDSMALDWLTVRQRFETITAEEEAKVIK